MEKWKMASNKNLIELNHVIEEQIRRQRYQQQRQDRRYYRYKNYSIEQIGKQIDFDRSQNHSNKQEQQQQQPMKSIKHNFNQSLSIEPRLLLIILLIPVQSFHRSHHRHHHCHQNKNYQQRHQFSNYFLRNRKKEKQILATIAKRTATKTTTVIREADDTAIKLSNIFIILRNIDEDNTKLSKDRLLEGDNCDQHTDGSNKCVAVASNSNQLNHQTTISIIDEKCNIKAAIAITVDGIRGPAQNSLDPTLMSVSRVPIDTVEKRSQRQYCHHDNNKFTLVSFYFHFFALFSCRFHLLYFSVAYFSFRYLIFTLNTSSGRRCMNVR